MTDFERMSASELDQWIALAAHERAKRNEPHAEQPGQMLRTMNPRWVYAIEHGAFAIAFQFGGHGWVQVAFDQWNLAEIVGGMTRAALSGVVANKASPEGNVAPAAPAEPSPGISGGGTVH